MLEGLEVTILNYKSISNNNFGRFDAEFFISDFITKENILKKYNCKKISDFSVVTDGEHGSPDLDVNSGIIYLSGNNIKENYIDLDNIRYCSKKLHVKNLRSAVKRNSVLMSIVGTVGKASVVNVDILANTDRNVATIKEISKDINPGFLSVFLNSKYGQFQTQRFSTGNVQPLLNLLQVKSIVIPFLSAKFQKRINQLILEIDNKREKSHQTYTQAENLLLETLGLKDFKPSQEKVNIKSFKDSFLSSGRLDAEYYQPKYEQVVEKIKESNYERLTNLVNIKKSIEPGSNAYSEEGLPFLRVADYNKLGLSEPQKCLSSTYTEENTEKLNDLKPKTETILFSKDGTVGMAYMLKENQNFITSGAILHLTIKNKEQVLPEYLTLVLNSQLIQMQAERDAGGSIILHWRVGEIENVVIPIIDIKIQQQISNKIEESFKLKKQSEQLLELAKTAVEKAIEESEYVAMRFIEEGLEQL